MDNTQFVLPELAAKLAQERKSEANTQFRKRKDFMKAYHDEWVKYVNIAKSGAPAAK